MNKTNGKKTGRGTFRGAWGRGRTQARAVMTPVPFASPLPQFAGMLYVGCFTVELDPVEFRSTYPEVIDAIRSFTTAAPGEAAHALEPAVGRMSSGKPPPRARWRLAVDGWEGVGSRSSERDPNGRNSRAQNVRAG